MGGEGGGDVRAVVRGAGTEDVEGDVFGGTGRGRGGVDEVVEVGDDAGVVAGGVKAALDRKGDFVVVGVVRGCGVLGDGEDGDEELDRGPWDGGAGRGVLVGGLRCGGLGEVFPAAEAPPRLVESFLHVRGEREDGHEARVHPFGQTGFEPLVTVVPFVGVMGRAEEVRLSLLE